MFKYLRILLCCLIVDGNRLDPEVFRSLSRMEMPDVERSSLEFGFHYSTNNNKLLSVHPENATFGLQDGNGPLTIELEIPSEEVILRGNFNTELNLPVRVNPSARIPNRFPPLSSSGKYTMYLQNFHLAVSVEQRQRAALKYLHLRSCIARFERVNVEIQLIESDTDLFGESFLEDMLQVAMVENYQTMLCNALRDVLTGPPNPIRTALLGRIRPPTTTPKKIA